MYNGLFQVYCINPERKNPLVYKGLRTKLNRISFCCCDTSFKNLFFPECMLNKGVNENIYWFLYFITLPNEPRYEISINVVCAAAKAQTSLRKCTV